MALDANASVIQEQLLMVIVVIAPGHIQEAIAGNIYFSSSYDAGDYSYGQTLMRNYWQILHFRHTVVVDMLKN